MYKPAAPSIIFGQKYPNEQKRNTQRIIFKIFCISTTIQHGTRKTCLCGGDTNVMRELDKLNKQDDTEKEKKVLSVHELPSKLINFYILTNARTVTVSLCNPPLQDLSAMALNV